MTEQELQEKIKDKFLSILRKLAKFIVEDLTKNASPQFRYLISGCMEAMERYNLSFDMNGEQRETYNNLFAQIGSRCRINPKYNNNGIVYNTPYINNMNQLEKIYSAFEKIDNFLSALEQTKKFMTIIHEVSPIFNDIGVNQNYVDEV